MNSNLIRSTIQGAWYAAEQLRPYKIDDDVKAAITPAGGDWDCVADAGSITRSIVWRHQEVCLVNSRGDLDDQTESQIAMSIRATPIMDKALRVIMNIATGETDGSGIDLIKKIAETAIAIVEQPAPPIPEVADR